RFSRDWSSDVCSSDLGTFSGLGHADTIEYLQKLGITTVELLPVHAFVDDRYLVEKGLRNYWGYNSIAFFAPEPRYMATPFTNERSEERRVGKESAPTG